MDSGCFYYVLIECTHRRPDKQQQKPWYYSMTYFTYLAFVNKFVVSRCHYQAQEIKAAEKDPPFPLLASISPIPSPNDHPFTNHLGTLSACNVCHGLVRLVACGELWLVFKRYNLLHLWFVTVMGVWSIMINVGVIRLKYVKSIKTNKEGLLRR